MIEFLNSLEWPAAFAIVASIVTIVVGLFGYLRSSHKSSPTPTPTKILTTAEYEKLHTRISEANSRVATNEGDLKEIRASIKSLQKQCADHEHRDITDFRLIDAKVERLMDIVVRILQDDKL